MRILGTIACALLLTAAGCGGGDNASEPTATPAAGGGTAATAQRSGSITVGAATWVREPAATDRALFGIAPVGGTLVAVGAGAAAVARSAEEGSAPTWRALRLLEGRQAARDWRGVVALEEGRWIAVGQAGLAVVPGLGASPPHDDSVAEGLRPAVGTVAGDLAMEAAR